MRKLICSLGVVTGMFASPVALAEAAPKISLNAITLGAAGRTDLALGMLEARVVVSPHVHLTATPTIVAIEGGDTEHQLRAAATLLLDLGAVRVDDRNLWVFSDAGSTRYRNRLRLTQPAQLGRQVMRFQLLNEAFYEERGRGWFRNMYGAGVGVDLGGSVSVDAYWMQQDDDGRAPSSLWILMLTAHLL